MKGPMVPSYKEFDDIVEHGNGVGQGVDGVPLTTQSDSTHVNDC